MPVTQTQVTVVVNNQQRTNAIGEVDPTSQMKKDDSGIASSATMAKSTMMFKWKREDHTCTDIPCCAIFVIWWLGMLIIAAMAINSGDPDSLLHGTDYTGNTCGSTVARNHKKDNFKQRFGYVDEDL